MPFSHDSASAGAVPVPGDRAVEVVLGSWDQIGAQAQAVRIAVFVVEQRIPAEEEWDEWDARSLHAVARDADGRPIGTGRLLPPEFDTDRQAGHIGRMAVLAPARRGGVGSAVLQALMQAAPGHGYGAIVLHAQSYVAPFYARHGFVAEGPEFLEVGIPHLRMRAPLSVGRPAG